VMFRSVFRCGAGGQGCEYAGGLLPVSRRACPLFCTCIGKSAVFCCVCVGAGERGSDGKRIALFRGCLDCGWRLRLEFERNHIQTRFFVFRFLTLSKSQDYWGHIVHVCVGLRVRRRHGNRRFIFSLKDENSPAASRQLPPSFGILCPLFKTPSFWKALCAIN
jgi:hypothetical protein